MQQRVVTDSNARFAGDSMSFLWYLSSQTAAMILRTVGKRNRVEVQPQPDSIPGRFLYPDIPLENAPAIEDTIGDRVRCHRAAVEASFAGQPFRNTEHGVTK
jgi:hypothetical protein